MPKIRVTVTTTETRYYDDWVECSEEQLTEWLSYANPNEVMEEGSEEEGWEFERVWSIEEIACPKCGTAIDRKDVDLGCDCICCGYDTSQLWKEE